MNMGRLVILKQLYKINVLKENRIVPLENRDYNSLAVSTREDLDTLVCYLIFTYAYVEIPKRGNVLQNEIA